jgi:sn-glycerol 3-phosphate transport system permease protein
LTPRVVFPNKILPYLLVAPQLAITLVFFYWPAGQALYQSMLREDPFGLRNASLSGSPISRKVLSDPNYLNSLQVTVIFSVATAFVSMASRCCWPCMADKVVRGKGLYRTLMIWPYAVAPAIAGMLWLFMFNPSIRHAGLCCCAQWASLGPAAQRQPGDGAGRGRRRLEADQLQFPVLRRRPAGHSRNR